MIDEEMQAEIEESYEHGLPDYLQDDLDNYKRLSRKTEKLTLASYGASFTAA